MKNVILITVDSVRMDKTGFGGYNRDTTPFLDELARNNTCFTNAYSPSTHTRESVPSVLTGYYPINAVNKMYRIQKSKLPELLNEHIDIRTGAFTSSPFFTSISGYPDGFDEFKSAYPNNSVLNLLGYGWDLIRNTEFKSGYEINNEIMDFVDESRDRFFAWGHLMDVHGPYNKFGVKEWGDTVDNRRKQMLYRKAKYMPGSVTKEEQEILINQYDNALRRLDGIIRHLFTELSGRGLLDDTLIVLTADHGELLGEGGLFEHKRILNNETLHVPLMIIGENKGLIEQPVSTVDICPTILDRLDIRPDRSFDGKPIPDSATRERKIKASCMSYFMKDVKEIEINT